MGENESVCEIDRAGITKITKELKNIDTNCIIALSMDSRAIVWKLLT
jgi:hypothetical protein